MNFTMQIQPHRRVEFPVFAWNLLSPPLQYLDAFDLCDLNEYDANLLAFDYILTKGFMSLSDIASSKNVLDSLRPIQLNIPIQTTIKMQGILREG